MANILVLYHSETNCTSEMAGFVARGAKSIDGMEVRLLSINEASADDVLWCDGMAVGSPTNIGTVSWQMKQFFDVTLLPAWSKVDGKFGCAFSSSGGWGGGAELTCQTLSNMMINYGFLVFGVVEYVSAMHTLHYGAVAAKAPREQHAQDACIKLGARLAEWLAVYVEGRSDVHPVKTRKGIMPEE